MPSLHEKDHGSRGQARAVQRAPEASQDDKLFRDAFDSMSDCFAICAPVRNRARRIVDFRYEFANKAAHQYYLVDYPDLVGSLMADQVPGLRSSGALDAWAAVVETGEALHQPRLAISGHWGHAQLQVRVFDVRASNLGGRLALSFRDITEDAQTVETLATSEERFRSSFDHSPIGLAIVSLDEGNLFAFERVNPTLCEMTGLDAEALGHMGLESVLDGRSVWGARDLANELTAGRGERYRLLARAGTDILWVKVNLVELPDGHALLEIFDVTEEKRAADELARAALLDPLTGLPNRSMALNGLTVALNRVSMAHGTVAALYIDLDHFKQINDTLGHDVGDLVLREVGQRLTEAVRSQDLVSRLGGDEFVIICYLQKGYETVAIDIVERVQASLIEPVDLGFRSVEISASVGLATATELVDPLQLLKDADTAMYEAKHRGRNRWAAYDEALHARALRRRAIEADLRRAVDDNLFRLHYQPIVNLATGQVVGTEALLRLLGPDGQLLGPGAFIEVAERSDLITKIGDWVLERASTDAPLWKGYPGFRVHVNLSGRELSEPSMATRVLRAIEAVDPALLVLEITEGVMVEGEDSVVAELNKLKAAGLKLAIDDFGTGFCSLRYLTQFPVDVVKIDRSFVSDIGGNRQNLAIVEAVLAMCRSLDLVAVAEGIETEEQARTLRALGCPCGQGYLFGRPGPAEELTRLLNSPTRGMSLLAA